MSSQHATEHPTDETLSAAIGKELADDALGDIVTHLSDCTPCQQRLETLSSDQDSRDLICGALKRESQSARSSSAQLPWSAEDGQGALEVDYVTEPADFIVNFLQPARRDDAIGRLGDFDIFSVIGFGGMGIVLKGFQAELNRPVAIKVMAPHLAALGAARKRFLREAQATAAIVHPNVMPVLSVSESTSLPFLVMPYVVCHSLQQRIDADGPLPIVEVLRVAIQVSHALAAAHAQGLVHRDVKPANILLERGVDRAMLTDFGLARAVDDATVTRSGVIAGTPQYMSPEQARGEPIDARSDLFSLGSVIYAMCVAHPPFRAETSYGILRKITDCDPRGLREQNNTVPEWLERYTLRLLEKSPSDRPESASDVATTLESCLAYVQQPTVAMLPESLRPAMRSGKMRLAWRGLAIVLAVTALAVMPWGFGRWAEQEAIEPSTTDPKVLETNTMALDDELFGSDPIDLSLTAIEAEIDELRSSIEVNDLDFSKQP